MSQRPQPVTSKFRNCYANDIYNISDDINNSSSAGSTSSLTSVLYHDSFDDESVESDDYRIDSQKVINNIENNNLSRSPVTGMYCKRIIARQPQYPGERVTLTKYDGNIRINIKISKRNVARKVLTSNKLRSNKSAIIKDVNPVSQSNKNDKTAQKVTVRKIAGRSSSLTESLNNDKRKPNDDANSEDNYSTNDFSSVSGVSPATKVSAEKKIIDAELCSSAEDTLSVSLANPSDSNAEQSIKKDQTNKILTAWEAWYLKKEAQKREKQEKESLKEKEKIEKETEEKSKRQQACQEKIQTWLIKKDETQKKEMKSLKKREETEKNRKEQTKEDLIKKSSEKYVAWKLEKLKREKEQDKVENEMRTKTEAEKMIKQAKAANAFKRWLVAHKDYSGIVPYSYGISDGKLTSYYDKTSNPPPSFFNPDPWRPVVTQDTKN